MPAIFVNLIRDVDLFRYLFGEIEAVSAMESHSVRHHPVEDAAVVSLRFASGVLGTIGVSDAVAAPWSWEMTAGENPAFPVRINPATRSAARGVPLTSRI